MMNLSAVMLFICFSTAYGIECTVGDKVIINQRTVANTQTSRDCASKDDICVRSESIGSLDHEKLGKGTAKIEIYLCRNEFTELCKKNALAKCKTLLKTLCSGNGECIDKSEDNNGETDKTKTCRSLDPDFKKFPSLFSSGGDSSPSDKPSSLSSTLSTRALLAIITALLGRIY